MTKDEFVTKFAKNAEITKASAVDYITAFTDTVRDVLVDGDTVSFQGFGSFSVYDKAEKTGRNPRTGEPIVIPAHKAVKFSVGKSLKEAVNG